MTGEKRFLEWGGRRGAGGGTLPSSPLPPFLFPNSPVGVCLLPGWMGGIGGRRRPRVGRSVGSGRSSGGIWSTPGVIRAGRAVGSGSGRSGGVGSVGSLDRVERSRSALSIKPIAAKKKKKKGKAKETEAMPQWQKVGVFDTLLVINSVQLDTVIITSSLSSQ